MDRTYWVVSPNVNSKDKTLPTWLREIPRLQAAFMGWPAHKDRGDKRGLGLRFAREVDFGGVIFDRAGF
jgi:hypothetical protein